MPTCRCSGCSGRPRFTLRLTQAAQYVVPSDDAEQLTVRADYRQARHPFLQQPLRGQLHRFIRQGGDRMAGHYLMRMTLEGGQVDRPFRLPADKRAEGSQQIAIGNDPEQLALIDHQQVVKRVAVEHLLDGRQGVIEANRDRIGSKYVRYAHAALHHRVRHKCNPRRRLSASRAELRNVILFQIQHEACRRPMSATPKPHNLSVATDRLGAFGSLLCALHCAALPLLLALLPGLSIGLLGTSAFETGFTMVASVIGVGSLAFGWLRHGRREAWRLLLPGLALLWIGAFVPVVHDVTVAHAISMALGGALIALAHRRNLRLSLDEYVEGDCAAYEVR